LKHVSSRYFSEEELEEYYGEERIHDKQVEYTRNYDIAYSAILTTPDGRHYRVYYCENTGMGGRYFNGQECEELFLVPKLTLELGYSSSPELETRISDDIMKADRGELVEMLENTEEELLGRDWGQ
jgi:hypothetical protein